MPPNNFLHVSPAPNPSLFQRLVWILYHQNSTVDNTYKIITDAMAADGDVISPEVYQTIQNIYKQIEDHERDFKINFPDVKR